MILYYLMLLFNRFHNDPRIGLVLFNAGIVIVTPVKIVGLFAVLAAILMPPPKDLAPRLNNPLAITFTAFMTIPILVSLAYSLPPPSAWISSAISFGMMLWVTRRMLCNHERLVKSLRMLILASTFASLWLYRQHFVQHIDRPGGLEQDSNYEVLTLITGIPLAFWLARHEVQRSWRRIATGCVLVMSGGVVLTQSRGGLIAAAAMVLLAALRSQRKFLNLALLSLASVAIILWSPSGLSRRFASIKFSGTARNGDEESTRIHVELVKAGINMIADHPLFGVGLEQFKAVAPEYNPELRRVTEGSFIAHNTYVQIAAECGLPMLALYLALMVFALLNCRAVRRSSNSALVDLAVAMEFGLLGYGITAASVTAEFIMPFWLIIFMSQNLREIALAAKVLPLARSEPATKPSRRLLSARSTTLQVLSQE
jgi:O-antigen ligase